MTIQPKVCAVIQARMSSERLPGKVLLNIYGKSVLEHIIDRLKPSELINRIILAIPKTKQNDVLENFAIQNKIAYYRGSENEVLERFYLAAKENGCETVVEIMGDNPLVDHEIVDLTIEKHLNTKADYSCTNYPSRVLPIGLDIAVLSFQALQTAYKNAKDVYQKEHVIAFFYENPDLFKITSLKLPQSMENPSLRFTLDTKEDFELITKIYGKLYREGKIFKAKDVLDLIKDHPELKEINKHIIQRTR